MKSFPLYIVQKIIDKSPTFYTNSEPTQKLLA